MNDGHKRKPQKHQNKTAFKIQFNPLALETHKKVSYRGLCKRCQDQIQWKIQYNKYKKMSEPAKCNYCHQKCVSRTYMRACDLCSDKNKVCPKCLDPESDEQVDAKLNALEQKKLAADNERKMNQFLKTLKQRSRRTVKRLFEKGTIMWSPQLNTFTDEEGNSLTLQFRQGYGLNSLNNQGSLEQQQVEEEDEDEDQEKEQEEVMQRATKDVKIKCDRKLETQNRREMSLQDKTSKYLDEVPQQNTKENDLNDPQDQQDANWQDIEQEDIEISREKLPKNHHSKTANKK